MTIYKPLKCETTSRGYCITATQKQEKYSNIWTYEICVARDGYGLFVIPCARTTWKKRFIETINQYS